jgi:hypothetical protein
VESGIAVIILLHSARVGQALLPVQSVAKGEQARVPVLLGGNFGSGVAESRFWNVSPKQIT